MAVNKLWNPLTISIIKKNLTKFHLLQDQQNYFLFDTENLSLLQLDPLTYAFFGELKNGNFDILTRSASAPLHADPSLLKLLTAEPSSESPSPINIPAPATKNVLERLIIHISNSCNLKCRYCYAQQGNYGQANSLMQPETACQIIDFFDKKYDHIQNIQFFGGEPLLNPSLISTICHYLEAKTAANPHKDLPRFSLVTNGTIISAEILHLLKKYQIHVTVSIDGNLAITDYLRGKGTYHKIMGTIKTLTTHQLSFSIEATYTRHHLEQKISLANLMDYFYENLGLHQQHIPFVAVPLTDSLAIPEEIRIALSQEAIGHSLNSLKSKRYVMDSTTQRLLKALIFKKPTLLYCSAGAATLCVSCQGDIYPCFMFNENPAFLLGNAVTNDLANSKLSRFSNQLREVNTKKTTECQHCFARQFCFGCIGNDYITTGNLTERPHCHYFKQISEFFLLNCHKILADPLTVARIYQLLA